MEMRRRTSFFLPFTIVTRESWNAARFPETGIEIPLYVSSFLVLKLMRNPSINFFSGKTEWAVTKDGRASKKRGARFERRPSQRFGPRQSHVARERQRDRRQEPKDPNGQAEKKIT